jgi:hypothetical protein
MITGTLVAGYLFNAMNVAGIIIGIYYGVVIFFYAIAVLFSSTGVMKKEIKKLPYQSVWKYPLEVFFIVTVFYIGYNKIAVCMVFEFFATIYLLIVKKINENEPEQPDEKEN